MGASHHWVVLGETRVNVLAMPGEQDIDAVIWCLLNLYDVPTVIANQLGDEDVETYA